MARIRYPAAGMCRRVALDKGEGFVKGRDILSSVCDTA